MGYDRMSGGTVANIWESCYGLAVGYTMLDVTLNPEEADRDPTEVATRMEETLVLKSLMVDSRSLWSLAPCSDRHA